MDETADKGGDKIQESIPRKIEFMKEEIDEGPKGKTLGEALAEQEALPQEVRDREERERASRGRQNWLNLKAKITKRDHNSLQRIRSFLANIIPKS